MIKKQLAETSLKVPAIGQGMGEYRWDNGQIKILRLGIELGMNLIDTAEEYDNGHSEEIVGKAIKGIREKVIICSKFSPEHSSYNDVLKAAEDSLKRLKTDYIDIYQLHWPNPKVPIEKTIQAMEKLVLQGKVRYLGVSNLYLGQLKKFQNTLVQNKILSVQTEYNLFDHFIEDGILPYCEKEKIVTIAYSPLDQGKIAPTGNGKLEILQTIAGKYQKSTAQIALNWLIYHPTVIAIPKTAKEKYVRDNAAAGDFKLSKEDFEKISKIFARRPVYVPVDKIEVSLRGKGNKRVYQTLEEALANRLNFIPSPRDLAKYFKNHLEEDIKPVRLIRNKSGKYEYSLVEGRIRYWAWVIAYQGKKSIPAYVRMSSFAN